MKANQNEFTRRARKAITKVLQEAGVVQKDQPLDPEYEQLINRLSGRKS